MKEEGTCSTTGKHWSFALVNNLSQSKYAWRVLGGTTIAQDELFNARHQKWKWWTQENASCLIFQDRLLKMSTNACHMWSEWMNEKPSGESRYSLEMSPKGPCVRGLVLSLWCYSEVMRTVRDGAFEGAIGILISPLLIFASWTPCGEQFCSATFYLSHILPYHTAKNQQSQWTMDQNCEPK
jgi:hypothetical protein